MKNYSTLLLAAIIFVACQNNSTPAPTAGAGVSDGSFYAEVKQITSKDGRLVAEFDRIDFLMGDAAVEAARREGEALAEPGAQGDTVWSVPNDYYIVNPETTLQTAEIAPDARVELIDLPNSSPKTATVDSLPGHEQLRYFPFELQVKGGKVVALRAQFVP